MYHRVANNTFSYLLTLDEFRNAFPEDVCPSWVKITTITMISGFSEEVKIDIEGHEDFFFRGAEKTLRDSRPTVLMEVNIAFYKARGVDNILDVFNSIFQGYLFYNGNKSNTDLHKLVSSDIENIIAKPI